MAITWMCYCSFWTTPTKAIFAGILVPFESPRNAFPPAIKHPHPLHGAVKSLMTAGPAEAGAGAAGELHHACIDENGEPSLWGEMQAFHPGAGNVEINIIADRQDGAFAGDRFLNPPV
jgi:hypothetical protein